MLQAEALAALEAFRMVSYVDRSPETGIRGEMQPDTSVDSQEPSSTEPVQRPRGREGSPVAAQLSGVSNSLAAMVFWGFVLRILGILLLHTWRVRPVDRMSGMRNFSFGFETGRIAASIANGLGFSNPFDGVTGPTAWVAPVYPYLSAGVFRLFGTYSQHSAFVLLAINSLFSALTAIPVYLIARRVYGERVARWSGWTWTLLPYAMYWGIKWIWETSLSAFLMAILFWLTLKLEDDTRLRTWLWWGFLWAVLALANPACISFLPFAGLWVCWRRSRQGLRWFLPAVASALMFLALLTPWEVRNYRIFHKFIFVRGNLGVEMRLGNADNADGMWMWWLHPTQNVTELAKYKKMGEVAYVAARKQEVIDFIHRDPAKFAKLCAARAVFYWAGVPQASNFYGQSEIKNSLFLTSSILTFLGLGLTIRRRKRGAFLFTTLLLVYPAIYYVTFPHARYRHPIEPMMLILAVYLISETREARMAEAKAAKYAAHGVSLEPRQATTLSVIIPCFNEKATIQHVVDAVVRADTVTRGSGFAPLNKEIVIVDDCSTDGTRDVLVQLERDFSSLYEQGSTIKVLCHQKNQGKGAAVRTGIQGCGGDIVLVQDADLEYDPHDFPMLTEPILSGRADAVFGNRFHGGAHRVLYFWHYQANRLLTLFCNMLSDLNLSDMEVGYKAFRREIFDHVQLKSDRFGFEPEITVKTAKLRCRIYEVPISYHGRTYAEGKKIGWKDGVAALWHMVKYRFFN